MRQKKIIRMREYRRSKEALVVDITSLLDILIIILFFLLKTYSTTGNVTNIAKEIKLPVSESLNVSTEAVVVQVSKTKVWVDEKLVVTDDDPKTRLYDWGGRRLVPLFNELVNKKNMIKRIKATSPEAKKFKGLVSLVIDKSIKYKELRKIMFTCAEAGYRQYKFVVLGNEM